MVQGDGVTAQREQFRKRTNGKVRGSGPVPGTESEPQAASYKRQYEQGYRQNSASLEPISATGR